MFTSVHTIAPVAGALMGQWNQGDEKYEWKETSYKKLTSNCKGRSHNYNILDFRLENKIFSETHLLEIGTDHSICRCDCCFNSLIYLRITKPTPTYNIETGNIDIIDPIAFKLPLDGIYELPSIVFDIDVSNDMDIEYLWEYINDYDKLRRVKNIDSIDSKVINRLLNMKYMDKDYVNEYRNYYPCAPIDLRSFVLKPKKDIIYKDSINEML